ncbi:MAG: type II toxin-antitoxin system ParD family antitoxin [bacterium]|jgi:putative addiction module CopG family antidote|nr:type II toxin-antitoxin system ParD family antitoxin [bacterium]
MEIALSSELEKIIEYKIRSGGYQNASEFIREAILRAVEHDQLKFSKLNEAIAIGMEQAERGEFSSKTVQDIIKEKEAAKKG